MEWTKEYIDVKQLVTGENLSVICHKLHGKTAGPHVHIQASVHGAELQGNAVILQLMEALQKVDLHGSITFVPMANPYASNNKRGTYTYGRFNPVTGHNWNRNYCDILEVTDTNLLSFCEENFDLPWVEIKIRFKSLLKNKLEEHIQKLKSENRISDNNKINLILQKIACTADGILDLHTGPTATRYLYTAEYAEGMAKYLLFKNVLVIPNEFAGAMDEASFMPWIHLQKTFKDLGREVILDVESLTLEFGSEETFCMDSAETDVQSILNYLKYKGMINEKPITISSHYAKLKNYRTIYSPIGGLADYRLKPGDHFKKGDIIANIYQMKHLDPSNALESTLTPIKADVDGIVINRCPSSAVHEGMELIQVMGPVYQSE